MTAQEFSFTDKSKQGFLVQFAKSCRRAAKSFKIDERNILISGTSFSQAIAETEKDLRFVQLRRADGVALIGPSKGKIAGCLLFRLCRQDIVHVGGQNHDDLAASFLQNFAALMFVLRDFLHVDTTSVFLRGSVTDSYTSQKLKKDVKHPDILREISYILHRRHFNQELLGVLLDMIYITQTFLDSALSKSAVLQQEAKAS